jgi:hypothetical protein
LGIHETDPLADIHPSMWPSVNKSLYDLAMLEAYRRRRETVSGLQKIRKKGKH